MPANPSDGNTCIYLTSPLPNFLPCIRTFHWIVAAHPGNTDPRHGLELISLTQKQKLVMLFVSATNKRTVFLNSFTPATDVAIETQHTDSGVT